MRNIIFTLVVFFITLRCSAQCTVQAHAGVDDTICFGQTLSLGATPVGTGGGPYTYAWSPGATLSATNVQHPTATPVATITYQIIVTVGGCHDTDFVTITVRPTPTAHAGASQDICAGTSAQLGATPAATGGTPAYSYSWSPGGSAAQHPNVTPAATTTYTLTVTDANGCTDTSQTIVYVHPNPIANFTFSPNNVCSNLPINFTNTSTGVNLIYLWEFGDGATATTQNASHVYNVVGNATGINFTVKLKVTTAFGCTDSITHVVTVNQVPSTAMGGPEFNAPALFKKCTAVGNWTFTFTLNTNNVNTTTATNTNYTIVFGGGAPATFTTTNAGAFPITHNYVTGTYNLLFIVTGTNGCVDTGFYTVFVGSNPSVGLSNPGNTNGCAPFSLTFPVTNTINNPPGTTYTVTYSDGSAVQVFNNPPASLTHIFTISSCGYTTIGGIPNAFYVRIVASNPCGTSAATVEPIYIATPPVPNFSITPPSPGCVNIPITFNNTTVNGTDPANGDCGTTPPLYWTVTPSTGFTIGGSLGTSNGNNDPQFWTSGTTAIVLNFSVAGNYTICLHVGNICIIDSTCQTVCINPALNPAFTLSPNVGCIPLAVTTNNTTPTPTCGTNTYNWTVSYTSAPPCGNASSFSFTGGTNAASINPSFLFSTAGVYTVTLTVTNPCGTFSSNQNVTVKKPPIVTVTPVTNSCSNPYVFAPTATVTNCGTNALTYSWTFGGGAPATSTLASPPNISFSGTGNHTITLAATNECGTTSNNTSFTIYVLPTANAGADVTICNGNFTTLNGSGASGTPGYSYFWTPATGLSSQFSSSPNALPNVTTTYTLTVTDANGCTGTDQVIVTVNPLPVATATPASQTFCSGGTTAITLSSNLGGTTFAWTVVQIGVSGASAGAGNNIAQTLSTTGAVTGTATYTITPTAAGPCPGAPIVVVITVNPIPVVNAGPNVTLCNQPIPYNLAGFSPAGGTWTGTNATAAGVFTPNGNGVFVLTYTVTALGCTNQDTMSVTVVNAAVVNAGNGFTLCVNAAPHVMIGFSPAGGVWSGTGVIGNNFDPTISGVGAFTLTYTFGAGTCAASDTIHVIVNALPVVGVNNATICVGQSTVLTANGANTYSWSPNTNLSATVGTSVTANPVSTIIYTVTGTTTATGCSNTASSTVTVNPLPVVNAGNNVVLCNQPIPYNLTGFSPAGGTWTGAGVTAGGVFTPSTVGVFVLTYTFTNGNNCTASDTMSVTVINPQIANAGNGFNICVNGIITALPAATPAGGTWTGAGVVGTNFNPAIAGVGAFILTYTFGTGTCLTTDTIHVTVNALPVVGVNNATICVGQSTVLTANGANTYSWSPNTNLSATTGTSVTANPVSTIIYTVTGTTTATGCSNTAASTVTVNSLPIVNAGNNVVLCNQPIPYNLTGFSPAGGTWTGVGVTAGGVFTPSAVGVFVLTYTFTNGNNCAANDTMSVTVIAPQVANAGNGFSICVNAAAHLMVGFSPAGGTWSGSGVVGNTFNPAIAGVGNFTLTYSFGVGTCLSTDTIQVVVNPLPIVGVNSPTYCFGNSALLTAFGANTYSWSPAGGLSATTGTSVTANPNVTTNYTVTGTAVTGCTATAVSTVTVNPLPVPSFTLPALGCMNSVINFNNTSTGGNTYAWNFGDGGLSALQNPSHTYLTTGNFTVHLVVTSGFGCVDSINHPIQIVTTPNPSFTFNPHQGCPPLVVPFTNTSTGYQPTYVWNFGNGQTFNGANPPQITFQQGTIGDTTYHITLTATNVCGSVSVSDSVIVHPIPAAHFIPQSLVGCSPFLCPFLNMSTGNPTAWSWNFGDGTTSNLQNPPAHNYTTGATPSTYTITLIVSNLCGADTATDTVHVNPNSITAFATASPTSGCAPLTISFNALALGATSVSWNFGNGFFSNQLTTTSLYANAGTYTAYFYANDGCSFDTVPITITVGGNPNMQFIWNPNPVCVGSPINFTNQTANLINVNWEFGDATTSNTVNPSHLYSSSGNYNVTLIGTSQTFGCIDSITHVVSVVPTPVNNFTFLPTFGCAPLPVSFTNNTTNATFYNWTFGDGNTSNIMSPVHIYQNAGTLNIQLISSTVNGCADTSTASILVNPSPVAAFTLTPSASCSYPVNVLTANASTGATGYAWNFGNGITSTQNNPPVTFDTTGNYNVQLICSNSFNCSDTATTIFHVYPQPLAGFFATPVDGCQPLLVQFSDTSHDAVSYNWIFGDGTSSNFPNPLHVYQNPGTYSVQLFISGTNNFCNDSVAHNNYITVYPKPTAAFTWENINSAAPNAQVVFYNSSSGAINYSWDFGDGENSVDDNPTHFFHTLGNFDVTLISISNHGCLDTTNHLINVDFAHGLFVPNAFTPNNGQPDVHVFLPVGLGLKFYHLQIFDTWGSLLFETTSLDATGAPDAGWDGRKNGTLLPQDAYVWKIDAVFQDEIVWKGNTYDGSYFSKTGTVTLLH